MKETYNDYHKKIYNGAYCHHYFYVYHHSEDLKTPHVKDPSEHEWYRYTKNKRHVFYEDFSKRHTEIIHPELVSHAGRPKGSKDSYKRTRTKKDISKKDIDGIISKLNKLKELDDVISKLNELKGE